MNALHNMLSLYRLVGCVYHCVHHCLIFQEIKCNQIRLNVVYRFILFQCYIIFLFLYRNTYCSLYNMSCILSTFVIIITVNKYTYIHCLCSNSVRPGPVRNISVIWVYAVVFTSYSGSLLPLQLVSFDLACYGK